MNWKAKTWQANGLVGDKVSSNGDKLGSNGDNLGMVVENGLKTHRVILNNSMLKTLNYILRKAGAHYLLLVASSVYCLLLVAFFEVVGF